LRLFIGTFIELPERKSIELFQESNIDLRLEETATIKWTPPSKLHITWCFLGEVCDDKVSLVKNGLVNALQELKSGRGDERSSASIIFTRLAFWPKSKPPNVIVLRPDRTDKYFAELARLIKSKTEAIVSNSSEQKEFKAHVTLARVKNKQQLKSNQVYDADHKRCSETSRLSELKFQELEQLLPLEVKINRIELIESSQEFQGGYRSIECFDLNF
jgi:2'-5' RNA ligase